MPVMTTVFLHPDFFLDYKTIRQRQYLQKLSIVVKVYQVRTDLMVKESIKTYMLSDFVGEYIRLLLFYTQRVKLGECFLNFF